MPTIKTVDIIIPVYNRATVFSGALEALARQAVLPGWQARLVVSDDGSSEQIRPIVDNFAKQTQSTWGAPTYIHSDHQGIAHARNIAVGQSRADIIFFLGADIFLRPGALISHLAFHEGEPDVRIGALGFVKWDPRLKVGPLNEWMVHGGPQNNFDSLLGVTSADARHFFYASHVSVKRVSMNGVFFDQRYKTYGWEDLDVGSALFAKGLTLRVLHQAVGLHHHLYTIKDIASRQYLAGQSFVLYREKHPDLGAGVDTGAKRRLKHWLVAILGLFRVAQVIIAIGQVYASPRLYLFLTSHWFLRGVWNAGKKRA